MIETEAKPQIEKMLITREQAAEALSMSLRELYRRTVSGEIPSVYIGRSPRYRPQQLAAWLDFKQSKKRRGNVVNFALSV